MTQNRPVSELDFFELKNQFREFLKGQDRFKDYNYEGSNISVLLDVLAYNTYQNNFYNNMVVSEMFLDSSLRESSVASHAKTLNYLPKSRRSSRAEISFDISAANNLNFVTIPAKTKFISQNGGATYTFYTNKSHTVVKNSNNIFAANCIEIFEGRYVKEVMPSLADTDAKYQLTNEDVDISSITVNIVSLESGERTKFEYASNIFGLTSTDNIFFLQKTGQIYEIYFGKDVFGAQPSVGDLIEIEYRITKGAEANGLVRFTLSGNINGNSISNIRVSNPSSGGAEREDINSVKFYAPKSIQVQERAVTETDYSILLKNNFPEISAISVIGGEKLTPPKYGRVAVYVDVKDGDAVSEDLKNRVDIYLRDKMPLGIRPIIYNPNFMFVEVETTVFFDDSKSISSQADITEAVKNSILKFSDDTLNNFGRTVRVSKLCNAIDSANQHIVSNSTIIRPFVELNPSITSVNEFEVNFNNPLTPIADYALRSLQSTVPTHPVIPKLDSEKSIRYPTVSSTNFRLGNNTVYLRDDGFGKLQIIRTTPERDIIITRNVGTVDYNTGKVNIINLRIDSFSGIFKLFAVTKPTDVYVSKSDVVSIREEDIKISIESART